MKNYFLGGLLAVGMSIPFFAVAASPSGWVLNKSVSSNDWISKVGCTTAINSTSCDYTGPSKALRVGYDYEFADEFWAGDRDRRMKNFCYEFKESSVQGDYNRGDNPTFSRTPEIANNGYRVNKNSSLVVLRANKIYQVKDVPASRSSSNLFVKYLIEYANDEAATTRYQHTECYPYEISRCGDGKVDTDWFKKDPSDPAEECDPAAPEWKNRTDGKKCSASCTIEQAPICNSTYNGKRVYTNTSSQYLNGSEGLCVSGSAFSFTPSRTVGNPRIFTWGCTSSVGSTSVDACSYKQYRCGDGIVSAEGTNWNYSNGAHYESCDPEASEWKNRTDGKKCNSSCNVEYVPASCGPLDREAAKYNSNHPNQRITENTAGLCGTGQLKAGSFKYDEDTGKYTWDCVNGSSTAHCDAQDLWCGDGEVTNGEQCDPNDSDRTGWKDGSWKTCNSSCKLEDIPRTGPLCSSVYNGVTEYTSTSNPWISTSDTLCSKGNLEPGSFSYNGTAPRKFTWSCTNDGITTGCVAYQQWCGDGQKNGNEACDPEDSSHSGWGDDGCSNTCEPKYGVKCGSKYNGKTTYLDISKDWINKNTPGLCDSGNVVNFHKHPSSHVYTWQCENHDKVSEQCRADQEWCGDQKRNGNEDCDGTDGCDSECKKIIPTTGCDQIFTGALRLGDSDPFYDVFNAASWKDNYLFFYDVNFKENHGNYDNKAQDPVFNWTSQLINNGMKVSANTSMKVLESNPYHIVTPPTARAWNNLYIEYTIRYDYVNHTATPSKSNLYSHKECAYYEISRCGDGQIDEEYGEECDPGDSSHTNWGNGGCDENTCTPVNVAGPICNSIYNGQTVENLTENDDLCEEGTVSDFEFDEATNTWTWKCDNVAGEGVDCSAKKPSKGTAEIEKVLQDKKEVDHTGQALDWKVTVTAKGGDITDFEIWDKMPIELDYVDFEFDKTHSQAGMDVKYSNRKPNPERSGNVNIHYWDVKGTLKEGNSITIIVKTKVNKMPEAGKDILNIACVIKDKETLDCDDDTPPSPKGTAEIEKVLQDKKEVDHTGQALDWKVTVTAKGGDITDFEIWDKMPIELDYVDFEFDKTHSQAGMDVKYSNRKPNPERSGNVNIHYWDVKGTLREGNSITIIVKSTVNRMPRSGENILNVACVIKDDKTLDCDNDTPPSPKGTAEIEKTLDNKIPVDHTGQDLTWTVKVTAKGGDISDFEIWDKMPIELDYVDFEVDKIRTQNGITVTYDKNRSPERSGNVNIHYWDVKGTLKEGNSILMKVKTTVNRMPGTGEDILNIACVVKDNKEIDCGEDTPPSPKEGTLDVIKTLISADKYVSEIGQELKWKISVKAKNGDVELDKIIDKFPAEYLEYTGYETVGNWKNEGISINTENADNQRGIVTWDVSGTLKEGHTIELIVYTKVHTMPDREVVNVGCVKPVDPGKEECGTGYTSSLRIKKYVWDKNKRAKSTTGNSGDTITYRIEFGNYGDTGVYVTLKDFLPKDIEVKESSLTLNYASHDTEFGGEDIDPVRGRWEKVDGVYINIYSGVYLGPNVSGVMMITGTALHVESSKHNRTNFVCIYENGKKIACDDAVYNVEEDKEFKCESLEGVSGDLTVSNGKEERTKEVTCKASTDDAKITIDCGDGDKETKEGVKSFTKTCTFKGVGTHTVKCTVENSENKISDCEGSFKMKTPNPPSTPMCLRIKVDTVDNEITCYANKLVKFKVNGCYKRDGEYVSDRLDTSWIFKCDEITNDVKCTVSDDGSFDWSDSTKTCEWEDEHEEIKTTPWKQTCFNVNAGNFSIEEGEILPFYWNLDRVREVTKGDHPYDQIDGNYGTAKDKIDPSNGYVGSSCIEPSAIATDSMVCTFGIYDGGEYFKGVKNGKEIINPLYTIKGPCLTDMTRNKMPDILKDWYTKMKDRYCDSDDDCLSFELPEYKSHLPEDRKDEYPDLLYSSVYYITDFGIGTSSIHLANGIGGDRGLKTPRHGTQEKSYGEYKIVLESVEYLQCLSNKEGDSLTWQVMTGDVTKCQSNFMLTNSYTVQKTPAGNITASTKELDKYLDIEGRDQKFSRYLNAIAATTYTPNNNVNNALDSFKKKYEKIAVEVNGKNIPNGVTVKKVPGKNIYFADGDIPINGRSDIKNPFTWVVDGKVTIKGDVKYNMMVLARDIEFEGNCTSNQNVKGIYYASGNLIRTGIVKNIEGASTRCSEGGLHVQGVLIGNNFENLMQKSRSNINNWFAIKNVTNKENERRKMIMDGASVLIEYSPSIFTKSTMPPGAEDFVSALSIYKQ